MAEERGPSGYPIGTDWRECKETCCRIDIKPCACNGAAFDSGIPFGDRWDLRGELFIGKLLQMWLEGDE